jgi:hypothetical protein
MQRLLALLALLCPTLAVAGPELTYGVAFEPGGEPSKLHLSRCEAACFAQVTFENRFLWGGAWTRKFDLNLNGFDVMVTIVDGEGLAPEVFSVRPPPGYIAEPATVSVEEGASGSIVLYPMPLS